MRDGDPVILLLSALVASALARPLAITVFDPKLPDTVEVTVRSADGTTTTSTVALADRTVANDGLRTMGHATLDIPDAWPWHITVRISADDEDARWVSADTASHTPELPRTRYVDLDGVPIPGLEANAAGVLSATNADGRTWFRAPKVILSGGLYANADTSAVVAPDARADVVVQARQAAELIAGSHVFPQGDPDHGVTDHPRAFGRWLPVGRFVEQVDEVAVTRTRTVDVPANGPVVYGLWSATPRAPRPPPPDAGDAVVGGVVGGAEGNVPSAVFPDGSRLVHPSEVTPIHRVAPEYPDAAKSRDVGSVSCVVRIRLNEGGVPTEVVFLACPDAFQDAVKTAVMASRWAPPTVDGAPSAVQFMVKYRFDLHD